MIDQAVLDRCEWQLVDFLVGNGWVFGEKVRGLVRDPLAEVYFTEGKGQKDYGWVWFICAAPAGENKQGREVTLVEACEAAELAITLMDGNLEYGPEVVVDKPSFQLEGTPLPVKFI